MITFEFFYSVVRTTFRQIARSWSAVLLSTFQKTTFGKTFKISDSTLKTLDSFEKKKQVISCQKNSQRYLFHLLFICFDTMSVACTLKLYIKVCISGSDEKVGLKNNQFLIFSIFGPDVQQVGIDHETKLQMLRNMLLYHMSPYSFKSLLLFKVKLREKEIV